jgi:hypothetical protein
MIPSGCSEIRTIPQTHDPMSRLDLGIGDNCVIAVMSIFHGVPITVVINLRIRQSQRTIVFNDPCFENERLSPRSIQASLLLREPAAAATR